MTALNSHDESLSPVFSVTTYEQRTASVLNDPPCLHFNHERHMKNKKGNAGINA